MYGLENATVRFGDVTALSDVSVGVSPGSVVALVGGDGAGKTTLLRALVGEVALDSGSVRSPGSERLGYLPATTGSWLDLTVTENLDFVGTVFGLRGDALRRRSDSLIESADLGVARHRLSRQLSGGMRRKLGFSLAMVHRPPLLVLDEPSTGVDPVSRVDLWRLVSRAAARGAAVLMSTTYLDEAERAEHLVVLDEGRVVVSGEPKSVVEEFTGTITRTTDPVRHEWAWRRGSQFHEVWPTSPPNGTMTVEPDLEDVVIARSLKARNT